MDGKDIDLHHVLQCGFHMISCEFSAVAESAQAEHVHSYFHMQELLAPQVRVR